MMLKRIIGISSNLHAERAWRIHQTHDRVSLADFSLLGLDFHLSRRRLLAGHGYHRATSRKVEAIPLANEVETPSLAQVMIT